MSIAFTPSGGIDRRSVGLHTDGTPEGEQARIVAEEERSLGRIQKHLAARKLTVASADEGLDYDAEMLSLRDQIQEARLEDVPPLIEEMERLTEVAARRGKVVEGAVDPLSPYFGRMVLEENDRRREVLIGKATYLDPRTNVRIVDWRDAPVSRLYYRYEEGDEYEERFGGREVLGEIITRRSVAIGGGQLRRIGSPQGIFVRNNEGTWRRAGESARLHGGQGAAMRPEGHHKPSTDDHRPGRLGVRVDDGRDEKFLPEITALIDARQFELITRSDAGLVVIQGGAGSGKTTIGLHRLAYLAFQDPKRFRADKMLVMVFNDALVRYIGKVLPALGVHGVGVVTFERWAAKLRMQHLRGLPTEYTNDTPGPVTRLKKHPVMLRVIDAHVAKVTERVEAMLRTSLEKIDAREDALAFWRDQEKAPLAMRLHRLRAWASPSGDGADAELAALDRGQSVSSTRPAPRSVALRHAIERTVTAARRDLLDVSSAWAEILTDEPALRAAFGEHAQGVLDDEDMRTALAWCAERCSMVLAELEARREDGEGDRAVDRSSQRPPAAGEERERSEEDRELAIDQDTPRAKLVARRRASDDDGEADDDDDDRSVGIDGAAEVEPPRLDREDDALLLRITQRMRGPLIHGRPQKGKPAERLRYEHILVDEAQDLSPVELAVVMGTSSKARSVTLAGDTAQRLHMDNGFEGWPQLLDAIRPRRPGAPEDTYPALEVEPLKVQYRSTHPIIELAQDVLGPLAMKDGGHAIRGGAPVELFRFAHSGEAVGFLGEALRELMQAEPRASIALVARYPEQADLYFKGLVTSEVPHLRRIAEQDFPFKAGIDVTDVRQVKGLEFDYVVLLEATRASYPVNDESRHLLHIAATRAAHQLWITSVGEPSEILPKALVDRAF